MENSKKKASTTEATASQDAKHRPLKTFLQGDVSASVWHRDHEVKGVLSRFYSVTFERSYKDKTGKFCYTQSFNSENLGALMSLCREASDYIMGLQGLVVSTTED